MMKRKEITYALMSIWLAIVSCNLPMFGAQPTKTPTPTGTTPSPSAAAPTTTGSTPAPATATVPAPTNTVVIPPTACTPIVTSNDSVNIRSGPGTVYGMVGALPPGSTASVGGKNADGSWWYINYSGTAGWVSGSVVTASCIPPTIAIVAAPPTPLPPSGTCKDGYVQRLIRSSDKVCVPPASKAQADADNAAADSRTSVTVYGAGACKEGFVWREAYSGDKVCVTPATRSQAASDNAAAASRWEVGAYGPHTCIAGFVWREATSGDDVCVTGDVRTQTSADNAAAGSRVASSDACISGYEWRAAFSGDKVCVTPAVKAQVAADNAAAPSHTW
jgi:hypothetical protein